MKTSVLDRKPVPILAGISFLVNIAPSLSGFYNWNYDSWSHLFFASHYMNSWFNIWDPRWFGGFSVTSYPPLVNQILALGGFAIGLGNAYVALNLVIMILLPVAMYRFCVNFLSRRQAFGAGLLILLFPAIYLSAYTYGQLPTLFALTAALFMGSYLWHYLDEGHLRDLLASSILAGITIASHHYTFICFTPIIVFTVVLTKYLNTRPNLGLLTRRICFFLILAIPLVIISVLPFWEYVLTAIPQVPVFHLSRANYLENGEAFLKFFLAPYLLFILFIPLVAMSAFRSKHLLPLFFMFILMFTLGLGGTTPLPRLIFGQWWQWLTYDRFALWAGILAIPLLAGLLPESFRGMRIFSKRCGMLILILVALLQIVGCAFFASEPTRRTFLPNPPEVNIPLAVAFLDGQQVGQQYRYLTLGFAEAQMEKLSTLSKAYNLDGAWAPGRSINILINSGIAMIDSSKFTDPNLITLGNILEQADQYNLKWVLANDWYYKDILEQHGFKLIDSNDINLDSRFGALTIWAKEDVPPISGQNKEEVGAAGVIWGIGPLLLLCSLSVVLGNKKPISQ